MLHIVNRSPFTSNAFNSCLQVLKTGDALLLIEDGVFAALGMFAQHLEKLKNEDGIAIALLTNDVLARGLGNQIAALPTINYTQFVEFTEQYSPSLTWS